MALLSRVQFCLCASPYSDESLSAISHCIPEGPSQKRYEDEHLPFVTERLSSSNKFRNVIAALLYLRLIELNGELIQWNVVSKAYLPNRLFRAPRRFQDLIDSPIY